MTSLVNKTNPIFHFWWVLVLFGLFFMGTGVCIARHTFETFYPLSKPFMVVMITIGLIELFFAWSIKTRINNWEWFFINGIVDLGIGLLLLLFPSLGMKLFHFILPFWLILRGLTLLCIVYTTIDQPIRCRCFLTGMAIVAILCGIFIIWEPRLFMLPNDLMEGIAFVTIGMIRITLGLYMQGYLKARSPLFEKAQVA